MEKLSKEIIMETFNTIRTNINFLGMDKEMKVFIVTSSVKNEGKTTISCNIASSYASIKKKVLLIDCDLRNPTVNKTLGIFKQKGLADLIMAEKGEGTDYHDYIVKINDYMDVITSGFRPPNPSELLSSKRLETILIHLREQYKIILLDLPPVLMVSDAISIQNLVDGILMVIKYGYTTKEALRESKRVFEVAGIRPTACIFNAVPNIKKRNLYYGYYGYVEDEPKKKAARKAKPYLAVKKTFPPEEPKGKILSNYRRKIK